MAVRSAAQKDDRPIISDPAGNLRTEDGPSVVNAFETTLWQKINDEWMAISLHYTSTDPSISAMIWRDIRCCHPRLSGPA